MMRKRLFAVSAALAVTAVGGSLAFADVADVYSVTGKATSGGTKAKPAAVSVSYKFTLAVGGGHKRGGVPNQLEWEWDGVFDNASKFPKCTAEQIDAAQSDKGCPKGSLVASGTVEALLGPDSDPDQAVACSKQVAIYNAGPGKEAYYAFGDPSKCAGVDYLAPIKLTVKKTSKGRNVVFPFPDNIKHPLPGLSGGFVSGTLAYKKQFVTKGGKKIPYLFSTGCKGTRTLHFTASREDGATQHPTAKVGKC